MSAMHSPGYMPWDRTGNRLLVQSSLGRNKPSNYALPSDKFVYGKLTAEDPQKITSVIYDWLHHQNSSNPNVEKVKDLITTNKAALKQLKHTSSQFSEFRKSSTAFKQIKEGSNAIKIKLPEEGHAYGKPLDNEDPIRLVMANTYGETDKMRRHSVYQSAITTRTPKISCHITKNHHLVKMATAEKIQKLNWDKKDTQWKLNKFTNSAQCRVDTRRKELHEDNLTSNSLKKQNSYKAESISNAY